MTTHNPFWDGFNYESLSEEGEIKYKKVADYEYKTNFEKNKKKDRKELKKH